MGESGMPASGALSECPRLVFLRKAAFVRLSKNPPLISGFGKILAYVEVAHHRRADRFVDQMEPTVVTVQNCAERHIRNFAGLCLFVRGISHTPPYTPATVGMLVALRRHVWLFAINKLDRLYAVENALVDEATIPIFPIFIWSRSKFGT